MIEYKSIAVETTRNMLGNPNGTINCEELDRALNNIARDGWELTTIEGLHHSAGSKALVCIFQRELEG